MTRFLLALVLAAMMIFRPEDVPRHWQPWSPINLLAEPNLVSRWKLRSLALRPEACRVALASAGADFAAMDDKVESDACYIRNRVRLERTSAAGLHPVETRCTIAARLLLWERHDLQRAAQLHLGSPVARIHHLSSFSCRAMRTSSGAAGRMSEHATANAVDISGFTLGDGRRISLLEDWTGNSDAARFLRAARDGLCRWFNTVLGPDYNDLHRDHFHADMGRYPTCR